MYTTLPLMNFFFFRLFFDVVGGYQDHGRGPANPSRIKVDETGVCSLANGTDLGIQAAVTGPTK